MPTALRRRVLRHMYLTTLSGSWLLAGTHTKFLDALLAAARVEHLMPKVGGKNLVCRGGYLLSCVYQFVRSGAV